MEEKGIIRFGTYDVKSSFVGSWEDRLPKSVTGTNLMSGGVLQLEFNAAIEKRICSCEEMTMYVIHGIGRAQIADEIEDIAKYTLMHVFGGQEYQIVNTGTEDLKIVCYMSPAHKEENFI